jgi:hypothetical protein
MTMSEVGRKSELTDELSFKIRSRVLDGMKFIDIQAELGIVPETWNGWVWRDYKSFRKMLNEAENERMLKKAKRNLEEFADMPVERIVIGEDGEAIKTDPQLVKIKQDTSKFLAETLGKDDGFAKRNELTGKDGKDLNPVDLDIKAKTDEAITKYLNDPRNNPEQRPQAN